MLLLVTTNSKQHNYSVTANEFAGVQPNIYMWTLAAYLNSHGVHTECIDSEKDKISNEQLVEKIIELKPKFVGVVCMGSNPSSSTMSMVGVIDFFKKYHAAGVPIKAFVWGGHPSSLPEKTIMQTDTTHVVVGEGYGEIVDLYNGVSSNRIIRTKSLIDVNELPSVDWKAINPSTYTAHNWHCLGNLKNRSPYGVVWTSMGCPHSCEFCCINNMFGERSYRLRDMGSVVRDIDTLVSMGVKNIKILDELFIIAHKRIDEFCDLLEKRKYDLNMWCFARVDSVNERILKRLSNVGMRWVAYGVETANEENHKRYSRDQLDSVVNWTKSAGINICADIIVGLENDDAKSMKRTYEMCCEYNFEWLNIYPCFAFPGTRLYKRANIKRDWSEYCLYGFDCNPMPTKNLKPAEVLRFRDWAFKEYHSRQDYLCMIQDKFGFEAVDHILRMVSVPLRRKLVI